MIKVVYYKMRASLHFIFSQLSNLKRWINGCPCVYPSFCAVTSDSEDVKIAQEWLDKKAYWYSEDLPEKYRHAFAEWNESIAAFPFMGGRVALSAAINALNLEPGDDVIIPGYTCVVVPNAFKFAGICVVYADIELDTYGLELDDVQKKITDNTKAILLQHLYGLVCRDYEDLLTLAREKNLYIIEDCTHATGARYKEKRIGNEADIAFYSSEHSKVFTTVQGGMVTTNDSGIAKKLESYWRKAQYPSKNRIERLLYTFILDYYRNSAPNRWFWKDVYEVLYGQKRLISTTDVELNGQKPSHYGQKMPAPLAALGLNQLRKVDYYNKLRREKAKEWDQWVETTSFKKPLVIEGSEPVFLRYPVYVTPSMKKDRQWAMNELQVSFGVWFKGHLHPIMGEIKSCPNASKAIRRCINLPTIFK